MPQVMLARCCIQRLQQRSREGVADDGHVGGFSLRRGGPNSIRIKRNVIGGDDAAAR